MLRTHAIVLALISLLAPHPGPAQEVPAPACCDGRPCPSPSNAWARPLPETEHPNVVLILADDLGSGDVGYHGSAIQTPNIDALAAEGVRLERFYVAPICTPTRTALMTGRSAERYGLHRWVIKGWTDPEQGLPAEAYTLAEMFRDAGYETAMAGKWHLGHWKLEYHPNSQGFDHFYGHLLGAHDYFEHTQLGGHDWQRDGRSLHESGYSTRLLAAEAERFLAERDPRRPFFLYLAFDAPHTPLQAPAETVERYAGITGVRPVYAAMVDELDQAIGRVLAALDREELSQRTLVIFLSDNGPLSGVGSSGILPGSKTQTFEGGIRVPAVAYWPGRLPAGAVRRQRMRDYDLLPTLVAATGIPLDSNAAAALDGLDMWASIAAGAGFPREPFLFAVEGTTRTTRGYLDDAWKYVSDGRRGSRRILRWLFHASSPFFFEAGPNQYGTNLFVANAIQQRIRDWEASWPPNGLVATKRPRNFVVPRDWGKALIGENTDGDPHVDACDNCPLVRNPYQFDTDGDGIGNACECGDADGNGRLDRRDVRRILRCAVGRRACSALCDVTGDGRCERDDAIRLMHFLVRRQSKQSLVCGAR